MVWFSLAIVNILFLTYYCYLRQKKTETDEDSQAYELHKNPSDDSSHVESTKPKQVKKFYSIKRDKPSVASRLI